MVSTRKPVSEKSNSEVRKQPVPAAPVRCMWCSELEHNCNCDFDNEYQDDRHPHDMEDGW